MFNKLILLTATLLISLSGLSQSIEINRTTGIISSVLPFPSTTRIPHATKSYVDQQIASLTVTGGTTTNASSLTTGTLPLARLSGLTDAQFAGANKDGAVTVASLRTLGTGALQAAAGNHTHNFSALGGTATPAQIGTGTPGAGKYVDGGTGAWTTLPAGGGGGGSGTVTSVALSVPSGLGVSGSPITTNGTLAITSTLNGIVKGDGSGFTTVVAPVGALVGTTDAQTLTNKNLNGVAPSTFGFLDATSSIQNQLNNRALASHTHSGADITSGTIAPARLGTGTPGAGKYVDGTGAWTNLPVGGGTSLSAGTGITVSGDPTAGYVVGATPPSYFFGPEFTGSGQSRTDSISIGPALAGKENALGNPSQNGYVLSSTTAGVRSWVPPATGGGNGTVTSVAVTVPAGLAVSGSPITTNGTIAISTTLNGIVKGDGTGLSAVSAPSGAIVGTTDPQTLTNKNIDAGQLTGTVNAARLPAFTGGNVTSSAGSTALVVQNNTVSNSMLTQVATSTLKGRGTPATGNVEDLTPSQVRSMLNVADGATANSTDAQLRDRATHTGTQPFTTITGTASTAQIGTGTPAAGKYVDGGTGAWTPLPAGGSSNTIASPLTLTNSGTPANTVNDPFVFETIKDPSFGDINALKIRPSVSGVNERVYIGDATHPTTLNLGGTSAIEGMPSFYTTDGIAFGSQGWSHEVRRNGLNVILHASGGTGAGIGFTTNTSGNAGFSDAATSQKMYLTGAGNLMLQKGGTYTEIPSSIFTVTSTTQAAVALPVMTGTQRDAIALTQEGEGVYNSTTHGLSFRGPSGWKDYGSHLLPITLSGNGSTTSFTVAHGLGYTPTWVGGYTANSSDANQRNFIYASADGTNVTIVYATAPASGTNNIKASISLR